MSTSQFTQPDDLIAIWRHCVHTLLSPADGEEDPASKALVADDQAMRMITLACPMTFLTEYRVYDVRSLEQMVDSFEPQGARSGSETVCFTNERLQHGPLQPSAPIEWHHGRLSFLCLCRHTFCYGQRRTARTTCQS